MSEVIYEDHQICLRCWIYSNPGIVPPRVVESPVTPCLICGDETHTGIWLRLRMRRKAQ